MKRANWSILSALLALFLFSTAPSVYSQKTYKPTLGQAGKDVIWVPTQDDLIQAMLDIARVTPKDLVMDLGSGDGRIVIAAAARGAHAIGIEYNPDLVKLSQKNAEKLGVSDRTTFMKADFLKSDFSKATVITMYLTPQLNLKLRPVLLGLKPGTRVVSHSWTMGEWSADQTIEKQGHKAYFWTVPAKVAGTWMLEEGSDPVELKLTQNFQKISGTLKANGKEEAIQDPRLEGNIIRFNHGGRKYTGLVKDKTIEGNSMEVLYLRKWSALLR
jgi:precorrin-6B methylase 2